MTGVYNSNSSPQLALIQASIPLIKTAVEHLDISPSPFPLIIADFGSSHGSNSVHVIKIIMDYIRESKATERSFLVVHNDLPSNNWKPLFDLLNEQNESFFGLSSGRSFYEQCLPSDCLTFGFSSASIHWLSRKPCNISNHCVSVYAQGEELRAFQQQAKDDYSSFLKNRSLELITGGVLLLVMNCLNDQGLTLLENVYDLLIKCAKLCAFTADELKEYTIPVYVRSYDECLDKELFQQYSLQLIDASVDSVDFKFYDQWKSHQITLEQFAQLQTGFVRCATDSILQQALASSHTRSKEEITELTNQFWGHYHREVKDNPQDFQLKLYQAYVALKKI